MIRYMMQLTTNTIYLYLTIKTHLPINITPISSFFLPLWFPYFLVSKRFTALPYFKSRSPAPSEAYTELLLRKANLLIDYGCDINSRDEVSGLVDGGKERDCYYYYYYYCYYYYYNY